MINVTISSPSPPSSIPCYNIDMSCKLSDNNLVEIVKDVESVDECSGLCRDDDQCQHFTHFSSVFSAECHLVSSCNTLIQMSGAVTGAGSAEDCLCSMSVVPAGDDLESVFADNEFVCLVKCRDNDHCSHYMFHTEMSLCKLYQDPASFTTTSNTALRTGPRSCVSQDNHCSLAMLDTNSGTDCRYRISLFPHHKMRYVILKRLQSAAVSCLICCQKGSNNVPMDRKSAEQLLVVLLQLFLSE